MAFKIENLEVWKLAPVYLDDIYQAASRLPKEEYIIYTASGFARQLLSR